MVTVKIYVEGGGEGPLIAKCRRAFGVFLEKAGFKGRMPKVVPCGSRNNAYDSFCTAMRAATANQFPVLLVDSEGAVGSPPWQHLHDRDPSWARPDGAMDDQVHLMVQCMEAWFLADKEYLAIYYEEGFIARHLPGNPNPEEAEKQALMTGLKMATRGTRKGEYSKGSHSFEILAGIDPGKVGCLPYVQRLFAVLDKKLK